jgi:hypothetical protein
MWQDASAGEGEEVQRLLHEVPPIIEPRAGTKPRRQRFQRVKLSRQESPRYQKRFSHLNHNIHRSTGIWSHDGVLTWRHRVRAIQEGCSIPNAVDMTARWVDKIAAKGIPVNRSGMISVRCPPIRSLLIAAS